MTTKEARQDLHTKVTAWLTSPPAEYDAINITAASIKRYRTAPPTDLSEPYWVMITTAGTQSEEDGAGTIGGGNEVNTRMVIILLARVAEGEDTAIIEASKEAAEDFLDDAEEYLVRQLTDDVEGDYWHSLTVPEYPLRDIPSLTEGLSNQYRSSQILIDMELTL